VEVWGGGLGGVATRSEDESVWSACMGDGETQKPCQLLQALEIISMVFSEDGAPWRNGDAISVGISERWFGDLILRADDWQGGVLADTDLFRVDSHMHDYSQVIVLNLVDGYTRNFHCFRVR
jgi:hypothetical protein